MVAIPQPIKSNILNVNESLAQQFYEHLISEKDQEVIRRYEEETLKIPYLTIAANFVSTLQTKRAQQEARDNQKNIIIMTALFSAISVFFIISITSIFRTKQAEKNVKTVKLLLKPML